MGFDREEIRIKATNISIMDRKGGKSIIECRVMSGAITTTASAHSHLGGRVRNLPGDSMHPLCRGLGAIRGGLLGMFKNMGYVQLSK